MWVFTKNGFFSAVQNNQDSSLIHVRARFKGDLEKLCKAYGLDPDVKSTPENDYPFRMDFTREKWAEIMSEEARKIDYTNFKGSILADSGPVRERVYLDVWYTLKKNSIHS